jgi:hypothetical protein
MKLIAFSFLPAARPAPASCAGESDHLRSARSGGIRTSLAIATSAFVLARARRSAKSKLRAVRATVDDVACAPARVPDTRRP